MQADETLQKILAEERTREHAAAADTWAEYDRFQADYIRMQRPWTMKEGLRFRLRTATALTRTFLQHEEYREERISALQHRGDVK